MAIENEWFDKIDDAHRHGQPWTLYELVEGWIQCQTCHMQLRRVGQTSPEA